MLHHGRLLRHADDLVAVGNFVDVPALGLGAVDVGDDLDEFQVRVRVRLCLRRFGPEHQVLHAEHLQVLHAHVEVGRHRSVDQTAHRVRRMFRTFGNGEEVIRGRARGFEVQAFHRGDATVGVVRQELEREARAVVVDRIAVHRRRLPQHAAVAVRLREIVHRVHDPEELLRGLVLTGRVGIRLLLVARVVPRGPTMRDDARDCCRARPTRGSTRRCRRSRPGPTSAAVVIIAALRPTRPGASRSGRLPAFGIAIEAAFRERPRRVLALLVVDFGIVETGGALRPCVGARVLQITVAYPLVRPPGEHRRGRARSRSHPLLRASPTTGARRARSACSRSRAPATRRT